MADQVLIVDMTRLMNESAPAQRIKARADALRVDLNQQIDTRRQELRDEEQEMVKLRETLEREAFNERAAAFEQRVRELKRDARQLSDNLQRTLRRAEEQLRRATTPILINIMSERGARVMLEKRDVVLSANNLDVTEEAIRRLNAADLQIEVNIEGQDAE